MAPPKQKRTKQTYRTMHFDETKYKDILEREPVTANDPCQSRREQIRKMIDVALGIRIQSHKECRFPMSRVSDYFRKKRETLRDAGKLVGEPRYRHTKEQSAILQKLYEAGEQDWIENVESVAQGINLTTLKAGDFKRRVEKAQEVRTGLLEGTMRKKLRGHTKTVRKDESSSEEKNDGMEKKDEESEDQENEQNENNDPMEVNDVPEDQVPDQLDQGIDKNEDVDGEDIPVDEEELGHIIRQDPEVMDYELGLNNIREIEQDLDYEPMIDEANFELVDGNDLQVPVEGQELDQELEEDNNDISSGHGNSKLAVLRTLGEASPKRSGIESDVTHTEFSAKRFGEPMEEQSTVKKLKIAEEELMPEQSHDIPQKKLAGAPEAVQQGPEPVDRPRPEHDDAKDGQDCHRSTIASQPSSVVDRQVVGTTVNGNENWFITFLKTALSDEQDSDEDELTDQKIEQFRVKADKCLAEALAGIGVVNNQEVSGEDESIEKIDYETEELNNELSTIQQTRVSNTNI